jgi:hypothetical protein
MPSGKTSVCSWRAAEDSASSADPGTEAADAANVVAPPFRVRSPNTMNARTPNTSKAPQAK